MRLNDTPVLFSVPALGTFPATPPADVLASQVPSRTMTRRRESELEEHINFISFFNIHHSRMMRFSKPPDELPGDTRGMKQTSSTAIISLSEFCGCSSRLYRGVLLLPNTKGPGKLITLFLLTQETDVHQVIMSFSTDMTQRRTMSMKNKTFVRIVTPHLNLASFLNPLSQSFKIRPRSRFSSGTRSSPSLDANTCFVLPHTNTKYRHRRKESLLSFKMEGVHGEPTARRGARALSRCDILYFRDLVDYN